MIPKPPDTSKFETPSACESCEVSKDVTDSQALTYIPYPVKKFVCEGCLESAGKDLNDLVESQQFDIAEVDEDSLNDFIHPYVVLVDALETESIATLTESSVQFMFVNALPGNLQRLLRLSSARSRPRWMPKKL